MNSKDAVFSLKLIMLAFSQHEAPTVTEVSVHNCTHFAFSLPPRPYSIIIPTTAGYVGVPMHKKKFSRTLVPYLKTTACWYCVRYLYFHRAAARNVWLYLFSSRVSFFVIIRTRIRSWLRRQFLWWRRKTKTSVSLDFGACSIFSGALNYFVALNYVATLQRVEQKYLASFSTVDLSFESSIYSAVGKQTT